MSSEINGFGKPQVEPSVTGPKPITEKDMEDVKDSVSEFFQAVKELGNTDYLNLDINDLISTDYLNVTEETEGTEEANSIELPQRPALDD